MEQISSQQDALAVTRRNMLDYFNTHDIQYVREDAVFINLSTGEKYTGRAEIGGMLHYIYQVAFKATADIKSKIITEDKALIEGIFTGTHIAEFAGIPATNKQVSVPICVTYDLENGLIKEARIYMLVNVLISQLTQ